MAIVKFGNERASGLIIYIVQYFIFLYDITVNSVFPLQRIILPSLWSGILLLITLAGKGKYVPEMILDIFY